MIRSDPSSPDSRSRHPGPHQSVRHFLPLALFGARSSRISCPARLEFTGSFPAWKSLQASQLIPFVVHHNKSLTFKREKSPTFLVLFSFTFFLPSSTLTFSQHRLDNSSPFLSPLSAFSQQSACSLQAVSLKIILIFSKCVSHAV